MKNKNILYGICGIGLGHTYRQLPIIEHVKKENNIIIFAYGRSYEFYKTHFAQEKQVTVLNVAVPFYVSSQDGIDFAATAKHPSNQVDFLSINAAAMQTVSARFKKTDLVITDYEPISVQYAYACNASLITIDQQSKYLVGVFPDELAGKNYKDEVAKLRMFFPKADKRIICSFFGVTTTDEQACIVAPLIRKELLGLQRTPSLENKLLVYLSSQERISQSYESLLEALETQNGEFHLFTNERAAFPTRCPKNVQLYDHGDAHFFKILSECSGIISTAGHTLLSEAMFLGIPVYAIPLDVFEQRMNAKVIHDAGFGIAHECIDAKILSSFIKNIPLFVQNIRNDKTILLRSPGVEQILDHIADCSR